MKNDELYKDFEEWLLSIEEDDPMEEELKYVYFAISSSNNLLQLSLSACDREYSTITHGMYFPEEAQNFFSYNFFNFCSQIGQNEQILAKKIFDMLKIFVKIHNQYKKRVILIGSQYNKPSFKIEVN